MDFWIVVTMRFIYSTIYLWVLGWVVVGWGSQIYCQPAGGQSWFLSWLAVGSGVYQSWHQTAGKRGQIPGWLVEGPKMSWSWCRPAGECDVGVPELVSAHWWAELVLRVSGSRGPGVGVGLLVGGFRSQQMAAGSWESWGWCWLVQ